MKATIDSSSPITGQIVRQIAQEMNLPGLSVQAVVQLLAEGATIPFIARYRKEATDGLNEVQIRSIEERQAYLVDLESRKESAITEIARQGKLTPSLEAKLRSVNTKAELEDLYLPYKPKRRTRALIAKEQGLEPLAKTMASQSKNGNSPREEAKRYVDLKKGVGDVDHALTGARDICAEMLAENAQIRSLVRQALAQKGTLAVVKTKEYRQAATKFDGYADYAEPLAKIPSHRFLAICRGEEEGILKVSWEMDWEALLPVIQNLAGARSGSPWFAEFDSAIRDGIKRLLLPSVQADVRAQHKLQADKDAVEVFAQNLGQLLLAAPYGAKTVVGIDPGQRTGCKCAVVDSTGKVLGFETLYLVQGEQALERAKKTLLSLCDRFAVEAVAVGNGTHGRETETFVRDVLRSEGRVSVLVVSVSEAGASVYSASEVAREELGDLDLTIRGAVSIARRLQDPLAELVKIDPKSIGVGQYQHDVSQSLLAKKLDEVVESCVSSVGVELNTASSSLLARVAGIGPSLAKRIVKFREEKGRFSSRSTLLKVPGIGPKIFEQAAGFLRVREGKHPLDASAVHPERYSLVERIAKDQGVAIGQLMGNDSLISRIAIDRYKGQEVGNYTLGDIVEELRKPGRDPRSAFEAPCFRDDVRTIDDLQVGMELEGVVTNVTAFGAFVDIGVHQDGLVHISRLADRFVRDPKEVVKVGDKISVSVVEVDIARRRIALSAQKGNKEMSAKKCPKAERLAKVDHFRNNPFSRMKS